MSGHTFCEANLAVINEELEDFRADYPCSNEIYRAMFSQEVENRIRSYFLNVDANSSTVRSGLVFFLDRLSIAIVEYAEEHRYLPVVEVQPSGIGLAWYLL